METGEKQRILVERSDRQIFSLDYDILGNVADVQDVCQDSPLSAYRAIGKFRIEGAFSTWIYRIVLNKALKYLTAHDNVRRALQTALISDVDPGIHVGDVEIQKELRDRETQGVLSRKMNSDQNQYVRIQARQTLENYQNEQQ